MKKVILLIAFIIAQFPSFSQTANWSLISFTPAKSLYSICCLNFDTVVAVGDTGYIIRTTNSGVNWVSVASNTSNTLYKVCFVNDTIGFAVGANGTVLKTTNYGQSWINIGINTKMSLIDMSFINKGY